MEDGLYAINAKISAEKREFQMASRLGLVISVWILSLNAMSQGQDKHGWGVDPINTNDLKAISQKLNSAAKPPAFKSIQAGLQFDEHGRASYQVLISLPGAEECKIAEYGDLEAQGGLGIVSVSPGFGVAYICIAHFDDHTLAIKAQQEIAKALDLATGVAVDDHRGFDTLVFDDKEHDTEWVLRVNKIPHFIERNVGSEKQQRRHRVKKIEFFTYFLEVQFIPPETLSERYRQSKDFNNRASREAAPGKPLPMAPTQTSPDLDPIRGEVEAIETGGRYSQMPPPQAVAPTNAVATGMIQRIIENGTAYSLTILITGPVSRKVILAPGKIETLTLPVGTYKIAAKVSAPNILPFFGIQIYSTGQDYQSQFYIQ